MSKILDLIFERQKNIRINDNLFFSIVKNVLNVATQLWRQENLQSHFVQVWKDFKTFLAKWANT